jgi:hypothetical protein
VRQVRRGCGGCQAGYNVTDMVFFGAEATMAKFPGLKTGVPFPKGKVSLSEDNVLSASLSWKSPLAKSAPLAYHIHAGYSCGAVGGHLWNSNVTAEDPWNTADKAFSSMEGKYVGGIDVNKLPGALPFEDNVGRALVVRNGDAIKVACGTLKPKLVSYTCAQSEEEEPHAGPPAGCRLWFDGCNDCEEVTAGGLACTRMYCPTLKEPKCIIME